MSSSHCKETHEQVGNIEQKLHKEISERYPPLSAGQFEYFAMLFSRCGLVARDEDWPGLNLFFEMFLFETSSRYPNFNVSVFKSKVKQESWKHPEGNDTVN